MAKSVKSVTTSEEQAVQTVEFVEKATEETRKEVPIIENPYLTDAQKTILLESEQKRLSDAVKGHVGWTLVTCKDVSDEVLFLINADAGSIKALFDFMTVNKRISSPKEMIQTVLRPCANINGLNIREITQLTLE